MNRTFVLMVAAVILAGCGQAEKPQQQKMTTPPQTVRSQSDLERDFVQEGMQHLKKADPGAAIKSFDQAIKQDPADPDNYLILGETYMRLRDYPRAIDSFSAALRVAPNRGDIYYLLAVNQGLMGYDDMAVESAQRSVEIFQEQRDRDNFLRSVALLQGLIQKTEDATAAPEKK